VNVDSVVIAEEPKIAPHTLRMRENIARVLGVTVDNVSVKGTTNEGLGSIGAGEAVAAYAVAVVK
jgi:2-C-methyl-D-erythritol 2,4-cyclodiphosphate synthase